MNKLKPSNENLIALEACILNNKTLKEAFNEFSQGDYTFSQIKRFYYKYKEELEEAYYGFMALIIILFIAFTLGFIFPAIFNIIQCLTFPEKVIYEYIATILEAK